MPHKQTINTRDPEYAWPTHLPPADVRPWPDKVDERLAALERESQEHTEEIANTDWNMKALLVRVEAMERESQEHTAELAALAAALDNLSARLQADSK
jgi:chromosome segregation ATPase